MLHNQYTLLTKRRFLPLYIAQACQALNDCIFKNAMVIFVTYALVLSTTEREILAAVASGIFILPFLLFSASAGVIADKYCKAHMIRWVKLLEVVIISFGTFALYVQSTPLLLGVLFGLGLHSTLFGPIKYAILPELLNSDELLGGNALVEASTYLAILAGSLIGQILMGGAALWILASITQILALIGFVASFYIPAAPAQAPQEKLRKNILKETLAIIHHTRKNPRIFSAIHGISWSWAIGLIVLMLFPSFIRDYLSANVTTTAVFTALFSLGIGGGALFVNKLLHSEIHATYVPLGVLGCSVFLIDMYFASPKVLANPLHLNLFSEFVAVFGHWRLMIDTLGFALCAGIYIVPLYALLQKDSEPKYRSRTIACNNIINSAYMVAGSLGTLLLLSLRFSVPQIFLVTALLNLIMAVYLCRLLPRRLLKKIAQKILISFFRVEVKGIAHYHQAGERFMILANHAAYIDILLLAAFLPDDLSLAVHREIAGTKWLKPFLALVDITIINPEDPLANRQLIHDIHDGKRYIIFPEGGMSMTRDSIKMYEAPGMIAKKADASILPIRINGAGYSKFTRFRHSTATKLFPKITLNIYPPLNIKTDPSFTGKQTRRFIGTELYKTMNELIFSSIDIDLTLWQGLLKAQRAHGRKTVIAEDVQRQPITYSQFIMRSFILGKMIHDKLQPKENIGILLPTSSATAISLFAAQLYGHLPAMLNFTSGSQNIVSACKTAQVNTLITSKKFIHTAKIETLIEQLMAAELTIVYLEDLKSELTLWQKIAGFYRGLTAKRFYHKHLAHVDPHDPAVILFTSGSEGTPKGVALSHRNMIANCHQLTTVVDINPKDLIFNALPAFHCFGLTVGTILPLMRGIPVFWYPSPLHYRIVPQLIYETNATVMFATDTFLNGYAKYAQSYDFVSIRYIFAGAEKLKPKTQRLWAEKFGVRIFEGYGVTETAPVAIVNTPMLNAKGSIGQLLPEMRYQIKPVDGIHDGGRLFLKGPNVMLGYLKAEHPGKILPPPDSWHDTGDIVSVDHEHYITIKGRAKGFAKFAGEMISLSAVETKISDLWPAQYHAVVSIPDEKKGEQLVLLTDHPNAQRDTIVKHFREQGINELMIPKKIMMVPELPILATGKIDYPSVQTLVVKKARAYS